MGSKADVHKFSPDAQWPMTKLHRVISLQRGGEIAQPLHFWSIRQFQANWKLKIAMLYIMIHLSFMMRPFLKSKVLRCIIFEKGS